MVKKLKRMSTKRTDKVMANTEQKRPKPKKPTSPDNKAQTAEHEDTYRTLTHEIENAKQSVILSTGQCANIIIKHRRRLHHAGVLQELAIEIFI